MHRGPRRLIPPGIPNDAFEDALHLFEALGKPERAERLRLACFDRAHIAADHCVRGSPQRVLWKRCRRFGAG